MLRETREISFFFIFLAVSNAAMKTNLKLDNSFHGFEKSVAFILKTEIIDSGNSFIVLYHSLSEKDENLNALMGELNKENIPTITHSKLISDNK